MCDEGRKGEREREVVVVVSKEKRVAMHETKLGQWAFGRNLKSW